MLKGCIYLFHFEKASPPDFRSVPLTCHLTIFLGGSKSAVWKCVFESISLSLEPPPAGLWRGGTVVGVKEWRQRCHRVPFLIFFILLIFLTFFYVFKFFWLFSFLFKKKNVWRRQTPHSPSADSSTARWLSATLHCCRACNQPFQNIFTCNLPHFSSLVAFSAKTIFFSPLSP